MKRSLRFERRDPLFQGWAESMAVAGLKTGWEMPVAELLALRRTFAVEDRRDLTGRLMGDPPQGRSALNRRASA